MKTEQECFCGLFDFDVVFETRYLEPVVAIRWQALGAKWKENSVVFEPINGSRTPERKAEQEANRWHYVCASFRGRSSWWNNCSASGEVAFMFVFILLPRVQTTGSTEPLLVCCCRWRIFFFTPFPFLHEHFVLLCSDVERCNYRSWGLRYL